MNNVFKVGDSVEVLSSATDMQELQASVGQSYKVLIVCDSHYQPYKLSNGWWYRECELKLIKPAKAIKERFPYFNPCVKDPEELTQSDLQFLTKVLSTKLTELDNRKLLNNLVINNLWETCDKENAELHRNFKAMNRYKNSNRKIKAMHKKLSVIQAKLKKQAGK